MNIELHIQQLILDGLTIEPVNRRVLQAAVGEELTRLLSSGGLRSDLLASRAVRSISAGEFQITNQMAPARLGNQIAQAVHSCISSTGAKDR